MRALFFRLVPAVLLVVACSDNATDPDPGDPPQLRAAEAAEPGAVFIMTNATSGNDVMAFPRAPDGSLGSPRSFATGGLGSGGGLGNQGSVMFAAGGRFLYAVNPGSDQITGFRVRGSMLDRIGSWPSGGDLPISLAIHRDLVYVLHDGAAPGVTGFTIGNHGVLTAIPNSSRPLSGSPMPDAAQASFSPDGRRLVVTEKATSLLVTYQVLPGGLLSAPSTTPSAAPTPFGFGFGRRGVLIVSEAAGGAPDASALSSYRPSASVWTAVSPAVGTTETAACWVGVTGNGRFAYATNTGSGTISGYRVRADGSLRLLDADGVTGVTGGAPIDLDLVGNRFLYALNAATQTVSAFRVGPDGDLTLLGATPGLPVGANGLAAR
jgi:6-phosphogluconolactonase (cycloisomerase 2 family)